MTKERDFNRNRRENQRGNTGFLQLQRRPGQDILILQGEELVITIGVQSMKPNNGGPVLTVNADGEKFIREEIEGKVYLNDGKGGIIMIFGDVDPNNEIRAVVMIGAPREYKIWRRELWEAEQKRSGKT